ncbi:MAG: NAD(P)H-dependent oxidoreductase subunit E [Caldisericia bacterium]|nr:NAD(P)H-dependent oxidoreductase subunit E [Caldisericia bacterium]
MEEKKHLLEQLHEIQNNDDKHYLPKEKVVELAKKHGYDLAQVYGVETFYTMYSTKPRGKHIIRICENQSCHMANSKKLIRHMEAILNISVGETTEDGFFTLELSSCLGMCSVSPAMMIDEVPYGNLTEDRIDEILATYKEDK